MMMKAPLFFASILSFFLLGLSQAEAAGAGFNRLKAAGQGVSTGNSSNDDASADKEDSSSGSSGGESSGSGSTGGSGNPAGGEAAGLSDTIFLGVFEVYVPTKGMNARMSVFGEPRKFLLGHRACTKIRQIRDEINVYFFKHPPKLDRRGNADTTGMDEGVRQAIKDALHTSLEYFTSIYVISGRYSNFTKPADLQDKALTDCAGVITAKYEMDKQKK